MSALKCPYCQHIWQPRVKNPKACPHCKRHFKEGYRTETVDIEVKQDWIDRPIEIRIEPTDNIVLCNSCSNRGYAHEGVFIWIDKKRYCTTHIIENITHQIMEYRDADPLGEKAAMREEIKAILVEALSRCEVILRK